MLLMTRLALISLFALTLASCASLVNPANPWYDAPEKAYRTSQELQPLVLPAGFAANAVGDELIILPLTQAPKPLAPNLLPPGSLSQQIAQGTIPSAET